MKQITSDKLAAVANGEQIKDAASPIKVADDTIISNTNAVGR